MSITSFSGPVNSAAGFQIGQAGAADSWLSGIKKTTGIADSAATTVLAISIPNANVSAVLRILVRSAITNASHTYDSTRVVEYLVTVTRVAGAAAAVAVSSAIGAAIATVSAGQTLTTALSAASLSGGATATQTCNLQITNVNVSAGTTETELLYEVLNGNAGGVTVS